MDQLIKKGDTVRPQQLLVTKLYQQLTQYLDKELSRSAKVLNIHAFSGLTSLKEQKSGNSFLSIEDNEQFWNEFFLLSQNETSLRKLLFARPKHEILEHNERYRFLFQKAFYTIHSWKENTISNALEFLRIYLDIVFVESHWSGIEIISIISGIDTIDSNFSKLSDDFVYILNSFAASSTTVSSLLRCLQDTVIILYYTPLITFFASKRLFNSLLSVLPHVSQENGFRILLIISLLANYSKFESLNEVQEAISYVSESVVFHKMCQVIGYSLKELKKSRIESNGTETSWFSSISSKLWLPSARTKGHNDAYEFHHSMFNSTILIFYELNRNNSRFTDFIAQNCQDVLRDIFDTASYFYEHQWQSKHCAIYSWVLLFTMDIILDRSSRNQAIFGSLMRPIFNCLSSAMIVFFKIQNDSKITLYFLQIFKKLLWLKGNLVSVLKKHHNDQDFEDTQDTEWNSFWSNLLRVIRANSTRILEITKDENRMYILDAELDIASMIMAAGKSNLLMPNSSFINFTYNILQMNKAFETIQSTYSEQKKDQPQSLTNILTFTSKYNEKITSVKEDLNYTLDEATIKKVIRDFEQTGDNNLFPEFEVSFQFEENDHRIFLKKVVRLVLEDLRRSST